VNGVKTILEHINIPKRLTKGKELVVLTKEEYERLVKQREEILHALHVMTEGEKAYREGKTLRASSLQEALRFRARH